MPGQRWTDLPPAARAASHPVQQQRNLLAGAPLFTPQNRTHACESAAIRSGDKTTSDRMPSYRNVRRFRASILREIETTRCVRVAAMATVISAALRCSLAKTGRCSEFYDRVMIAPVGSLPAFDRRGVAGVASAVGLLLFVFSGRYGYHRDELYFIASGRHLAWGYPDQPVMTPLLARLMTGISSTSLVVLRLPSDLAAATTVFFAGLTARELGFGRAPQVLTSAVMAMSGLVLASGHLLSTETFNLTAWTITVWLGLRALRTGDERWWLAVGVATGVGLFDSDLVFFLGASVLVGVAATGPRTLLRSPWLLAGVAAAVGMWTPYLVWQARHGWPQLTIARNIAHGGSGTSAPRAAFLPEQLLLAGPWLSPFLVVGVVVLWRRRDLQWVRPFVVALLVLVVVFIVTGAKPYYLGGMFPLLFAAGADAIWAWSRRRNPLRRTVGIALLGVLSLPGLLVVLPVLPIGVVHDTPIVAANYDAGETIGWPAYVAEIAQVYQRVPPEQRASAIVLASNYGEAGAAQRYGPGHGLPAIYGVQNAFWLWGPPPATARTVVAVGFDRSQLTALFEHVTFETDLNNHQSIDNDEQGVSVSLCTGLRQPWSTTWRNLRDYG